MAEPSGFDAASLAAQMVVVVVGVFLAIKLLPVLAATALDLLPSVVVVWFVLLVLRGVVRTFLS